MGKLVNEFCWTPSRSKSADWCLRSYWNSYYGYWDGWLRSAPQEAQLLYRLKKITNLTLWSGSVTHDLIKRAITDDVNRRLGVTHFDRSPSYYISLATELLRERWVQSRDEHWRHKVKGNLNLFEHYYGREIPTEQTDRVKATILESLQAFFTSEVWAQIQKTDPQKFLVADEFLKVNLGSFLFGGAIDLALQQGEFIHLWDWKTGVPRDDDFRDEYGLLARELKWQGRPVLAILYLSNGQIETRLLDDEQIAAAEDRVRDEAQKLLSLCRDPENNVAAKEDFPMTDDRWKCTRCEFFEACYGSREIPRDWKQLVDLEVA